MVASASPVEATPPSSDQMVEAPVAFCHMTGEEMHENENLNMILEKNSEAEQSAFEHENVVSLALKAHHQLRSSGGGLNESLVALIDTACTSCMHSKAWREAYSRSLPEGFHCEATDKTKVFHFADGSSTGSNVAVWNIPIFLLNRPGAVLSAEIPTGTTPLLLSISSLVALDAVIFMRRRVMQLKELDLEEQQPNPLLVSSAEDLFVYFNEEAEAEVLMLEKGLEEVDQAVSEEVACKANFRLRGISAEDKRGELHERRAKELANTMRRLTKEDERCWAALRKQYTLAEQTATYSFSSTVVFEPFGGSFKVTRVARQQYGWTCSQPLDLLDGYDLLTKPGRRLLFQTLKWHRPYLVVVAFDCRIWSLLTNMSPSLDWNQLRDSVGRETLNLVQAICQYQCQHGRYYLVENPGTSAAWQYHGILTKLLNQWDGKFILGDQCAYGLVDQESKRPIKKSTGWLSNNECVLNKLGKKCRCAPNSHQQVIGRNQGGLRSRQAAAYPLGICQAICQGILQSMKLEYVAMHQQRHFAFPVEDENEIVETPPFTEENILLHNTANEAEPDVWQVDQGRRQLIRYHGIPRQQLFVPNADTDCPIPLDWLTSWRLTKVKYLDGEMVNIEDDWMEEKGAQLLRHWTGSTIFDWVEPEATENHPPDVATSQPPEEAEQKKDERMLQRRRARTRQLQRGLWIKDEHHAVRHMMNLTVERYEEDNASDWISLGLKGLGRCWYDWESSQANVRLILAFRNARRMRKPQPFLDESEAPLRKTFLLMENGDILTTGWEDWRNLSRASQLRPLPAQARKMCLILFGQEVGEDEQIHDEDGEEEKVDQVQKKEEERERKWNNLPRELKLAIARVHQNLGHARTEDMLRALRISRASETAIKACRLFKCKECPRVIPPKIPRPSKLPIVDEFGVMLGMDVFEDKDADKNSWTWLNIVDQGTNFQVCILLPEVNKNPNSKQILEAFEVGWCNFAGMPERGLIVDRAKGFLGLLAEHMANEGCIFEVAAKASPWQLASVERAGGTWKSMFRRLVWSKQVAGRDDVLLATGAVNAARNSLTRKSGFSPQQWVLGKSIRLPSDLMDDSEISRIGAMAASMNPGTRFHRKNELRMAAREAYMKVAHSEALKRAELRQVRPSRGPFHVGQFVFFYDQADAYPGPQHWRGIARVVGHEGSRTVWLSHRGMLIAASPEHLSHANQDELDGWLVTSNESILMDAQPGTSS